MVKDYKNNAIDLFKLFFAIMVVAIHTHAFADFGLEQFVDLNISGYAVPFFFIASGYFLRKKIMKSHGIQEYRVVLTKWIIKLGRLYFTWALVQFPLQIIVDIFNHEGGIREIVMYRIHYWIVSSPGGAMVCSGILDFRIHPIIKR